MQVELVVQHIPHLLPEGSWNRFQKPHEVQCLVNVNPLPLMILLFYIHTCVK